MKTPILHHVLRAALVLLAATGAQAQPTTITTYSAGDLFLGFRQTGAANTLAVKIGSAAQFLPVSLGGTNAPGNSFKVRFGVIPGTATPVLNLNEDLTTVFGASWTNNPTNGSGVRWAVVGFTDDSLDNVPITGLNARSIFVTRPRTNPAVQSTALTYSDTAQKDLFAQQFAPFAYGTGAGAYVSSQSTTNSSTAFIGSATAPNNWNTKIQANGSFGLGSARRVEQGVLGNFTGPTDSVLDLYLAPYGGSTLVTNTTYLGNFTVNNAGELTFTAAGPAQLTPYQAWVQFYNLTGANTNTTADPDQDGFNNTLEFGFGTPPNAPNGSLLTTTASGANLVVTYLARTTTNEATYTFQSSTNLATPWAADPGINATNGPATPTPPANYTRRQFTVPASGSKFFRIQTSVVNP